MTGPTTLPEPVPNRPFDPWNFRPDVAEELRGAPLAGCKLEATDGRAGTVADASALPDQSYLVITTGKLGIGGRTHLPAGVVNHVDPQDRKVYVDRTRAQLKSAPELKPEEFEQPASRAELADYYQRTYQET